MTMVPNSLRSLPLQGEMWRHFKGNTYTIVGVGRHTETEEQYVVYKKEEAGEIWIRSLDNFMENVADTETGSYFRRFEHVSEEIPF